MPKFEELIEALKDSLKKQITTESTTDQIASINALEKQVDDLSASHQTLVDEHKKMKELYIQNVVNYGSADKPKDQSTPRTLEEIAREVLAKKDK